MSLCIEDNKVYNYYLERRWMARGTQKGLQLTRFASYPYEFLDLLLCLYLLDRHSKYICCFHTVKPQYKLDVTLFKISFFSALKDYVKVSSVMQSLDDH